MVDFLTKVLSNIWWAIGALLILTIVLHFLLVYPKNLTKKQWKKIDYVWISLTAIGLIGATNNTKSILVKGEIYVTEQTIPTRLEPINTLLSAGGSSIVCREYVRNEFSPDNFDDIVRDYDESCEWSKKIFQIISRVDTKNYQEIDISIIPPLETTDNKWFRDLIINSISEYNDLVKKKKEQEKELESTSIEGFSILAPLFLILGLAIRITKTTGEIRYERS